MANEDKKDFNAMLYDTDFVVGLCAHCLTDYWNDIMIGKKLQKEYIPPMKLEEFRDAYYA